jgi:hypothetical protein
MIKINFNINKYKYFFTNLLVIEVISHIFYKVSFENFLLRDFEINKIVYYEKLNFYRTELESPFNTIFVNLFNIQDKEYSTLFLLGGWLVTISWWIGFVENISVLLIVLYYKNYLKGEYKRFYIYLFLLCFNHFGIGIFSTLIFLIINNFKKKYQILYTIFASFIVLRLYLNLFVNFQGRGRIRFIFNNNTLDSGTGFIANSLKEFYWSGFMGLFILFIFVLFISKYENILIYIASVLIGTIGAAITTDSTRIFSIIIVPLIVHLIIEFKNYNFYNLIYKKLVILFAVFSNLLIGEKFVHGEVWTSTPNIEMESVYNFFARLVNTLMKNIWA